MVRLIGGPQDGLNVTHVANAEIMLFAVFDKRTKRLSVYERSHHELNFNYIDQPCSMMDCRLFIVG